MNHFGEIAGLQYNAQYEYRVRHLSGDVVVDVGAHIGTMTLKMAKLVGPEGRVIAYEPQVKIYQELLINLDLNGVDNVCAHFAALGDSHARIAMDPPMVGNEGGTSMGKGGNLVELHTLDSHRLESVALIKIDVEGAEDGVLLGAEQTILRHRPVIVIEIRLLSLGNVVARLRAESPTRIDCGCSAALNMSKV